MRIEYIVFNSLENNYRYDFSDNTLIFSDDNSKGKTTLIRILLYSLGYQIPATEGIGDFDKYEFEIKIIVGNKEKIIKRKGNAVGVIINENQYNYIVPAQENELFSLLFEIENITILNNLLAVYYIDQEKGWTLLNRGKIIGNNRFNIEEFIAGISNIDINSLLDDKKVVNHELKKYRYFKNVIEINSEFEYDDNDKVLLDYEKSTLDELIIEQKELEIELKKIENTRRKLEKIICDNARFADTIESYGIMISHNGEEFGLTKENLLDFKLNQELLKTQVNNYKIRESKIKKQLIDIVHIINEKNSLFSMDDLLANLEKSIDSLNFDLNQINKVIVQLTNKRNLINKSIKEKLVFNNEQLIKFYKIIELYAEELEVSKYISDKSPKFVLTNQLKGLSGRILAQMSFVFKLSYIKNIDELYGIKLPIIIDSPRTNELSEKSTNDMLKILNRDFKDYQIIMASIYESSIINFEKIDLNDGLMSNRFITK